MAIGYEYEDFDYHPWCSDPSRDEAVRAVEEGRDRPLPTLGECIDKMFPKSVSASSAADHENKVDGMRTERITLEVTHDLDARLSDWIVEVVDESLGLMESVRVVHEPKLASHANADGEANHAAPAARGGGEGDGTFFGAGGPFNFQYAEDSFFPPNVHGFLRQCVKIKDAPAQPRGWLTQGQRFAIEDAIGPLRESGKYACESRADLLQELIARSTPPEVVLPGLFALSLLGDRLLIESQVKEALAAAGVAVKEVGRE